MSWNSSQPSLNILEELLEHPLRGSLKVLSAFSVVVIAFIIGGRWDDRLALHENSPQLEARARLNLNAESKPHPPLLSKDWRLLREEFPVGDLTSDRVALPRVYLPSLDRAFVFSSLTTRIHRGADSGAIEFRFGNTESTQHILRLLPGQILSLIERRGVRIATGRWELPQAEQPLSLAIHRRGDTLHVQVAALEFSIPGTANNSTPLSVVSELPPSAIELLSVESERGDDA